MSGIDLFSNSFMYEKVCDKRTDAEIMADAKAAIERRKERKRKLLAMKQDADGSQPASPTSVDGDPGALCSGDQGAPSTSRRTVDSRPMLDPDPNPPLSLENLSLKDSDKTGVLPTHTDKCRQSRPNTLVLPPTDDTASATPANTPPASPPFASRPESRRDGPLRSEKRSILDKFRRRTNKKESFDESDGQEGAT